VTKSPSGYLVTSIRNDYTEPKGFESKEEKAKRLKAEAEKRKLAEEAKRAAEAEASAREEADKRRIEAHWNGLSPAEQEELWKEALAKAPSFLVGQYRRNEKTNPKQAEFYWQIILESYLSDRLNSDSSKTGR